MSGCTRALPHSSVRASLLLVCMMVTAACGAADGQGGGTPKESGKVDAGSEDAAVVDESGDGDRPPPKDSNERPGPVAEGDAGTVDLSEVLKRILPPIPISPIPPPRPPG